MEDTLVKRTIKTGFQYLEEMIQVRNLFNTLTPTTSPMTNRVCFIIEQLNNIGANYKLHTFDSFGTTVKNYNTAKLVNIIVEFKAENELPGIVFMAHHDINNIHSENCQDNSASVCNLIELCDRLKNEPPARTTYIAFTDKEEFGGIGATNLSIMINKKQLGEIEYVINLELTGLGNAIWIDNAYNMEHSGLTPLAEKFQQVVGTENLNIVNTPFNDAMVLRRFGIDAICTGILPEAEMKTNKRTWSLCHSNLDTIDKINPQDMQNFVDKLVLFI